MNKLNNKNDINGEQNCLKGCQCVSYTNEFLLSLRKSYTLINSSLLSTRILFIFKITIIVSPLSNNAAVFKSLHLN